MKPILKIVCLSLACIILLALFGKLDIGAWEKPWESSGGGSATGYKEVVPGDYYIEELTSFGFSSSEPKSGDPYQLGFYQIVDRAYYETLQEDYGAERIKTYMLIAEQDTLPADSMTEEAFDAAKTVYTKNQVKPILYEKYDFYLLRQFLTLTEEDYGKRFVGFGMLEISDGTHTARYYSSETDLTGETSFPGVAFVMEENTSGTATPNLQLFTTVSRSVYDNLVAEYGAAHVRMESVCELSRFALVGNRISAAAFHQKYEEVADWQKVKPETFAAETDTTYTFGGAIQNKYFNAYGGVVFPYAFFEVTDETGAIVKRVYGTTEILYQTEKN